MKKFVLLFCLILPLQSFAQTLEDDRLALVAIYNATQRNLAVQSPTKFWVVPGNQGDNPCGWEGVECETVGGQTRVTFIDIDDVGGHIPDEVGNLDALKYLHLRGGEGSMIPHAPLSGIIPASMKNLNNLEIVVLQNCIIQGESFGVLFNIPSLKHLTITATSPIPDGFDKLINLVSLGIYGYNGNAVKSANNGPIPLSITKLKNLSGLSIYNAGFSGPIPQPIGNMEGLGGLNISYLEDAGPIPSEIGSLRNLTSLTLSNNHTGSIPASFSNLTKLAYVNLRDNKLSGPIPLLPACDVCMELSNNNFNFDAIEPRTEQIREHYGQRFLKLNHKKNVLSVYAGGTLSRNIYSWYKNGKLLETKIGDSTFSIVPDGAYHVTVKNYLSQKGLIFSETYNPTLPVTLISFTGKESGSQNLLTWQTASEKDNAGFEIEQSEDARTFHKIGFVDGSGDSKEMKRYQFADRAPFAHTYYRLKQLDHDGAFEYSRIISVKNASLGISVYPNPATSEVVVKGALEGDEASIINANGVEVARRKLSASKKINVSALSPGMYTLIVGNVPKKLLIAR